ncbi:hypothetical protein HanHA300_Chr10g0367821 [Helianthus annuus]|nr:hypothetical protein HanHA300_Chr10g0367821 [Helianthus annuus]
MPSKTFTLHLDPSSAVHFLSILHTDRDLRDDFVFTRIHLSPSFSLISLTTHISPDLFINLLCLRRLKHMPRVRVLVRTARRLIILIGLKRSVTSSILEEFVVLNASDNNEHFQ